MYKKLGESIEDFYSIDPLYTNDKFDGFQLLKRIVQDKLDGLEKESLPLHYYKLVEQLQIKFPEYGVFAEYYSQFPNLSLRIDIGSDESYNIIHKTIVRIKISLLTKHFTIFFEEMNWFNSFSTLKNENEPLLLRIISSRNGNISQSEEIIMAIKNAVSALFDEYEFVDHHLLFTAKQSTAVPIGFMDIIPDFYPIYAFLFGEWVEYLDAKILP